MPKQVFFLCYSKYVLFMAYMMRKLYHNNDVCTLIISDVLIDKETIEYIGKTGIWNNVIEFSERDVTANNVEENVRQFIEKNEIDVFYTAHVLRCASHYFIHYLKEDTEINLFDEGIISLDLKRGYEFYKRRGLPNGWIEFEFDRIDNFYVLFPKITKSIGKAKILSIDLDRVLQLHYRETISELNTMFHYQYTLIKKDVMLIDSDMAKQGSITQEYEDHCIDNIMKLVDTKKCVIKLKPSITKDMVQEKYGKYNVDYMPGENVPFELVYMNAYLRGDLPKVILALPTTAIWNIQLINQKFGINDVKIITLSKIMYEYFFYPGNGNEMMEKISNYQKCFSDHNAVMVPNNWEELYTYFNEKYRELGSGCEYNLYRQDYCWLVQDYNRVVWKSEKNRFDSRNIILKKWLLLNSRGIQLEKFFLDKGLEKIILYGYGVMGDLFVGMTDKNKDFEIDCIIKSESGNQKYMNGLPVYQVNECKDIIDSELPILITAVGKEDEIIQALKENNISNPVYKFMDLVNYYDNE